MRKPHITCSIRFEHACAGVEKSHTRLLSLYEEWVGKRTRRHAREHIKGNDSKSKLNGSYCLVWCWNGDFQAARSRGCFFTK